MPALNFQKQFVPKILEGTKRQTIRSRKRPIKVGSVLYLYTGQRTKNCSRIGTSICTWTHEFELSKYAAAAFPMAFIDGERIPLAHLREIAIRDGFETLNDFLEFFLLSPKATTEAAVTTFSGQIIKWGKLCRQ